MKNLLRTTLIILVVLCFALVAVACSSEAPTTTKKPAATTAPQANTTTAPQVNTTTAPTVDTTAPQVNTTTAGTVDTTAPTVDTTVGTVVTDDPLDSESFLMPNAVIDGEEVELKAFMNWGYFVPADDGESVTVDLGPGIALFRDHEFTSGTIEVTITSLEGNASNDNGLIFGCGDPSDPEYPYFFENDPVYYFVFVNDAGGMHLARTGNNCDGNGNAWQNLVVTESAFEGYTHGDTFTIKVETDGASNIKCYFNDELAIDYTIPEGDADLSGTNFGIRGEHAGVVYHSVTITND